MRTSKPFSPFEGDIMIVDDTEANVELLTDILRNAGYRVRTAGDGKLALRSVRAKPPALILLDIKMPGMDGYEVCRSLKEDEKTRSIPVIFISALEEEREKVKAFQVGGVDYITKPFQPEEVLARINTHLTLWSIQQNLELRNAELVTKNLALAEEMARREWAEQERAAEAERLRVTLHSIGDGVITTDTDGLVERLNPVAEALTGWRQEEARGKPLEEVFRIFNEGTRQPVEDPVSKVLSEGLVVGIANHTVLVARDGKDVPIADSAAPIRDEDGTIAGVVLVFRDKSEERAAQRLLIKEKEKAQQYLDVAGVMLLALDTNGHVTLANRKGCEILGYPEGYVLGKDWFEGFLPDKVRDEAKGVFSRIISGHLETDEYVENVVLTSSGETRLIAWRNSILRDQDGSISGLLSSGEDITERKALEEALRESEERYRTFFDTSRDGVFMTRMDGQFIDFNDVALEVLGYGPDDRDELLKTNVANVYANPEEREAHAALVANQGYSKEYPVELLKRDGTVIHTLITTVARKDSYGIITGFQGTVRDITERKRAEEELENTLNRFYTIISSLYAAVLLVGDEGQVEFANQAFCDLFDLEDAPSELRGLGSVEMIKKIQDAYARPADAVARIQEVVTQQSPVRGEEIAMRGGKTYLVDFIPLFIDGKGSGRLWHHQDITGRKRSEELALQAARLKSVADLSSGVAHHFNNLLQIVMASTSLSLFELESGDLTQVKTNLEKMLQAATLGAETVKRLQTFANIRADVTEGESNVFDLSTTARNAADVSQPLWKSDTEKKGIKIDLQLNLQEGCLVKGQENEIFEVLVNLIRNAAEALPQGGDIEVKTYGEADEVVIAVRDSGTGIAEHDLPKVFQPFWSSKGVGIGKGMGLAVTHGLVKRHGGSISVDSKEGVGTTFTIRLLLASEPVAKTEQSSTSTSGDHLTIMVIDDDVNIASLLERICAKEGHTVYRALSGQEGLEIFNKEAVDLVISDLGMPGMNGWDLGKAIRSICQEKGVSKPPFILLTGYGGQELEKEKIIESGVDAVVAKPIDRATVLATIQQMVEQRGRRP